MITLLTLAAVVVFALLLAAFIFGVAIGRVGRDALRLELANLKGKHETLSKSYAHLRELAGKAVDLAKERHFGDTIIEWQGKPRSPESNETYHVEMIDGPESVVRSMPNYIPPSEKHCPQCSVSVRAESWPQECPACHCMFGFDEQ